ncbi:hypothetical protein [Nocardia sp. NBC_01388]|uniref:hypothetical protein n=1 Tax=Nocardia sp. NBC_01388 TaxID=2903596 RepID=UPI0032492DBD
MQNISIGRYSDNEGIVHRGESGEIERIEKNYAGWIEGARDDGSTWIMWLDAHGNPECYWGRRDADGGVIGDPVLLAPTLPQ